MTCETCGDSGVVSENHGGGMVETLSCPDCGHRRDYSQDTSGVNARELSKRAVVCSWCREVLAVYDNGSEAREAVWDATNGHEQYCAKNPWRLRIAELEAQLRTALAPQEAGGPLFTEADVHLLAWSDRHTVAGSEADKTITARRADLAKRINAIVLARHSIPREEGVEARAKIGDMRLAVIGGQMHFNDIGHSRGEVEQLVASLTRWLYTGDLEQPAHTPEHTQ